MNWSKIFYKVMAVIVTFSMINPYPVFSSENPDTQPVEQGTTMPLGATGFKKTNGSVYQQGTSYVDRRLPAGIKKHDDIPGKGLHKGWEQGKHKGWDKEKADTSVTQPAETLPANGAAQDPTTDPVTAQTTTVPVPAIGPAQDPATNPVTAQPTPANFDVDGSGKFDFADVQYTFDNLDKLDITKADFNNNGRIDFADVVLLFNKLPTAGSGPEGFDMDGNGTFNFDDVKYMFNNLSSLDASKADFNNNGRVDFADVVLAYNILGFSNASSADQVNILQTLNPERSAAVLVNYTKSAGADKAAALLSLIETPKAVAMLKALDSNTRTGILSKMDSAKAGNIIASVQPGEATQLLGGLGVDVVARILATMDPAKAGAVLKEFGLVGGNVGSNNLILAYMDPAKAGKILDTFSADDAKKIFDMQPADTCAGILSNMDTAKAAAAFKGLDTAKSTAILASSKLSVDSAAALLGEIKKTDAAKVTSLLSELDKTNKTKADQIREKLGTVTPPANDWAKMDPAAAAKILESMDVTKALEALNGMDTDTRKNILSVMDPVKAGNVIKTTDATTIRNLLGGIDVKYAAAILGNIDPVKAGEVLRILGLDSDTVKWIIIHSDPIKAGKILDTLSAADTKKILDLQEADFCASILINMNTAKAAAALNGLDTAKSTAILASSKMSVDSAALLLGEIKKTDEAKVTSLLSELDKTNKTKADQIRKIIGVQEPGNGTAITPEQQSEALSWLHAKPASVKIEPGATTGHSNNVKYTYYDENGNILGSKSVLSGDNAGEQTVVWKDKVGQEISRIHTDPTKFMVPAEQQTALETAFGAKPASFTKQTDSLANTSTYTYYDAQGNKLGQMKETYGSASLSNPIQVTGRTYYDKDGKEIAVSQDPLKDIQTQSQPLTPAQIVTDTTIMADGKAQSTIHRVTDYTYAYIDGKLQVMKEITNSNTTYVDGGSVQLTTVKTYSRDAKGVCTGVSQTATGTMTSTNEMGGVTTYTLQNYTATSKYDPNVGWYIASESYNWVLNNTPPNPIPGSNPADFDVDGSGKFDFADVQYMFDNLDKLDITKNDFNNNGRMDFADVVLLFNKLPTAGSGPAGFDMDGNGSFNFDDVEYMFNNLDKLDIAKADFNNNGRVDFADVVLAYNILGFANASSADQVNILQTLNPERAAALLGNYTQSAGADKAAALLSQMDAAKAATILQNDKFMGSQYQNLNLVTQIIAKMAPDKAAAILSALDTFKASAILNNQNITVAAAATILSAMNADKAASILGYYDATIIVPSLTQARASAILGALDSTKAAAILASANMHISSASILLNGVKTTNEQKALGILTELDKVNKTKADQIRERIGIATTIDWATITPEAAAAEINRLLSQSEDKAAEIATGLAAIDTAKAAAILTLCEDFQVSLILSSANISDEAATTILNAIAASRGNDNSLYGILNYMAYRNPARVGKIVNAMNETKAAAMIAFAHPESGSAILKNISVEKAAQILSTIDTDKAALILSMCDYTSANYTALTSQEAAAIIMKMTAVKTAVIMASDKISVDKAAAILGGVKNLNETTVKNILVELDKLNPAKSTQIRDQIRMHLLGTNYNDFDLDNSGTFEFADVTYLFNNMENLSIERADFNNNGRIDFADIVFLSNKLTEVNRTFDINVGGGGINYSVKGDGKGITTFVSGMTLHTNAYTMDFTTGDISYIPYPYGGQEDKRVTVTHAGDPAQYAEICRLMSSAIQNVLTNYKNDLTVTQQTQLNNGLKTIIMFGMFGLVDNI